MTVKVSPWDIYNRYTIIKQVDKWKNCRYFLCRCICWKEKEVRINHLRNWDIKSCWRYNLEEVRKSCFTHWMTQARIYKIWNGIIKRCTNIEHDTYKNYWWRWIKCERSSFEEFYKDMKKWYSDKLSIDRIDNNWNYSKSNCRWATMKEQARNRSNNIYYNWKCFITMVWRIRTKI